MSRPDAYLPPTDYPWRWSQAIPMNSALIKWLYLPDFFRAPNSTNLISECPPAGPLFHTCHLLPASWEAKEILHGDGACDSGLASRSNPVFPQQHGGFFPCVCLVLQDIPQGPEAHLPCAYPATRHTFAHQYGCRHSCRCGGAGGRRCAQTEAYMVCSQAQRCFLS